jgi:hypothetical protein
MKPKCDKMSHLFGAPTLTERIELEHVRRALPSTTKRRITPAPTVPRSTATQYRHAVPLNDPLHDPPHSTASPYCYAVRYTVRHPIATRSATRSAERFRSSVPLYVLLYLSGDLLHLGAKFGAIVSRCALGAVPWHCRTVRYTFEGQIDLSIALLVATFCVTGSTTLWRKSLVISKTSLCRITSNALRYLSSFM